MIDWRRFLPIYWLQNDPTDHDWDAALNRALDTHGVTPFDWATCKVGPHYVWVENWPYAYGSRYASGLFSGRIQGLPTVRTRLRLRRELHQALIKQDVDGPHPSTHLRRVK